MWTPPQRIKHALPEARWPSEAEAERSLLFSPININHRVARQRTWVPAMVPWRATAEGLVTEEVVEWYARFAAGRPGVIVVEATGIRDVPSGPLLRIGHDRFIPGLRRLVEAVREASGGETLLFIQLIDFLAIRRRPERRKFLERFLEITDSHREACSQAAGNSALRRAPEPEVRSFLCSLEDGALRTILSAREWESMELGYRERVTDVHLPHVRDLPNVLPDLFASAAERAFASGFDGAELHYAHAYTMASFLSPTNTREDGYGSSREGRARLPLEVIQEVRRRIGADRILGARFLGDEVIEEGGRIDDACFFANRFAAAGLDFLSISKGGKFDDAEQPKVGWAAYPYTGPSGYECMPTVHSDQRGPFGRNIELAGAVRDSIRAAGYTIPIVGAGGINQFDQAESMLRRGRCDIIGAARQSLADPDWFLKMRLGRGGEIRRCHLTNYCEALDQQHKQVTCKLWDRTHLDEPDVRLDATGHRRLVAPRWLPGKPL